MTSENPSNDLYQEVADELDQSKRSLNEVNLMLEQSQVELSKLTQRNTSINGHLQQVQSQFESMPRGDIRMAYNAALDAQQRLLVMRGQLEKLRTDQTSLQKFVSILEKVKKQLQDGSPATHGQQGRGGNSAMLEMVIDAQESERQRLSRQMHDGPAQALSNFIVQTEIASRYLELDAVKAKEELNNLKTSAMGTFQKVRDFIFDLRPMMLDDLGLFPTVRRYVDSFKEQTNVEIRMSIHGQERRLEPFLEVMIFRSIQELLRNSVEHNQDLPSKLQIETQVYIEDNLLKMVISDNGKGFNPEILTDRGVGLKFIRERVEMIGGYLEIDSALGQGCRVSFQVPITETS